MVSEHQLQQFIDAGCTSVHVIEIILGISVKMFISFASNVIGIPLNDEFNEYAWQPKESIVMGQQYFEISDKLKQFIEEQKIFFVGTATTDSRVNISPKGMDSLKILSNHRIVWLNVTGSGNETSAHIQENNRMTLMFAAFEGKPMILRLYGKAKVVHKNDSEWEELFSVFQHLPGARQIFDLTVDLVQTSCGMAVPFFDYVEERELLNDWATKQGEEGLKEYWQKKNQESLDGKPTKIISKNI